MAAPKGSPKPEGSGRTKGTTNKVTKELKDLILGALDASGGQKYLEVQAIVNPVAFMSLVGKLLPKDINKNVTVKHDWTEDDEQRLIYLATMASQKLNAVRESNDRTTH